MEKHLKKLPEPILSLVYRARDIARDRGVEAYLVGGFVRDLLLGRENFDLDIAVEGDAIEFARYFSRGLECRLVAHRRFGTATLILPEHKIDFAMTRKESYPEAAALPVVAAGTIDEDLFRRDFTINTLAIGLGPGQFGRLIDIHGGKADLEAGIVRILHDKSFIDDPTRILRAVRFEQRFGFHLEPRTLRLLKAAVRARMLFRVEPQRLRDELALMMKERLPLPAITRCAELAGFRFLSPRIRLTRRLLRLLGAIEGEVEWFHRDCSPRRRIEGWTMYLTALFQREDRARAEAVCSRFAFGKGERSRILAYTGSRRAVEEALIRPVVRPSRIFDLLEPLPYEVILLIRAGSVNVRLRQRIAEFFLGCHGTCVAISGHDLESLGIAPGPQYQRILKKVLEAKLNGALNTREEELAFAAREKDLRQPRKKKGIGDEKR